MPRLDLSLDLEPTVPTEMGFMCWCCNRPGCEWKFVLPFEAPLARGLHTKCKIAIEQKRRPSTTMQAVKPP